MILVLIYDNINVRKAYKGEGMELQERLKQLRETTGMNRKEFAEYFGVPYRTMQDWELGNRTISEYLLRLMEYKVNIERLIHEE